MFTEEPLPRVTVGEMELSRHPTEALHYRLSLAVHNGTDRTITSFRMDAVGKADYTLESGEGKSVRLIRRCSLRPGTTPFLELQFLSPYGVVPPHPLELKDIRFHSFRLDDGTTETGEVLVPFPVKEM